MDLLSVGPCGRRATVNTNEKNVLVLATLVSECSGGECEKVKNPCGNEGNKLESEVISFLSTRGWLGDDQVWLIV